MSNATAVCLSILCLAAIFTFVIFGLIHNSGSQDISTDDF